MRCQGAWLNWCILAAYLLGCQFHNSAWLRCCLESGLLAPGLSAKNPCPKQKMWESSANVNWEVGVGNRSSDSYLGSLSLPNGSQGAGSWGGDYFDRISWKGVGCCFVFRWLVNTFTHACTHKQSVKNRFPQKAWEHTVASVCIITSTLALT